MPRVGLGARCCCGGKTLQIRSIVFNFVRCLLVRQHDAHQSHQFAHIIALQVGAGIGVPSPTLGSLWPWCIHFARPACHVLQRYHQQRRTQPWNAYGVFEQLQRARPCGDQIGDRVLVYVDNCSELWISCRQVTVCADPASGLSAGTNAPRFQCGAYGMPNT